MPLEPQFSFFIAAEEHAVQKDDARWRMLLPAGRSPTLKSGSRLAVTLGDYFSAARLFLSRDEFAMIARAAAEQSGREVSAKDVEKIRIRLEKHGHLYHPARIEVLARATKVSLVLNVAFSASGQAVVAKEYRHLKRLNNEFTTAYIPRVYDLGRVELKNNVQANMFIGQWFEGYHEFHISQQDGGYKKSIAVWDPENPGLFLSSLQTKRLYRQVAAILTSYYNLESFEQIFPWHHGAGDFVVNVNGNQPVLKLITVRDYKSVFNAGLKPAPSTELLLQALLIFFLSLSIRTRLDRTDGVGDIAWADDIAVAPTVSGFFDSLARKRHVQYLPAAPATCFKHYLSRCTAPDLLELLRAVADMYPPNAVETPVVRQQLKAHAAAVYRVLERIG